MRLVKLGHPQEEEKGRDPDVMYMECVYISSRPRLTKELAVNNKYKVIFVNNIVGWSLTSGNNVVVIRWQLAT